MVFLSICTALYDYVPQSDSELAIKEGELIYVLEKSGEDDWWKAKKRAPGEADDEPVGLIPNNYVKEVSRNHRETLVIRGLSGRPGVMLPTSEPMRLSV